MQSRFPTGVWQERSFRSLDRHQQWMYFVLMFSTRHTNSLGVIPITATRWSNLARDVTPTTCFELVRQLALAGWIAMDESTDEILLCRYMQDNNIDKQPHRLRSAIGAIEVVWSPLIRLAIADVLSGFDRLDAQQAAREIRAGTTLTVFKPVRAAREPIAPGLRQSVYVRDGWRCCYCHLQFPTSPPGRAPEIEDLGVWLELDHIKPYSLGGPDTYENFRSACSTCNRRRGVDDADLWAAKTGER